MPSGTAVVDAFRSLFNSLSIFLPLCLPGSPRSADLIRHGRNHHNTRTQDEDEQPSTSQPQKPREHQARETREQPYQKQPQTQAQTQTKMSSTKYKDEVQKIVQEEREAKSKMPTIKGLENFKLVDKMGEYVPDVLRRPSLLFMDATRH